MIKESIALFFKDERSDKVYNAELVEQSTGCIVNFAYGKRGNSLTTGTKTKEPVTYEVAKKAYDKLVNSKTAKGYKEKDGDGQPINTVTDKVDSNVRPQLLNELTEKEAQKYIDDDDYCMQEKFDGRRRLLVKGHGYDETKGVNKKGIVVPLTSEVQEACEPINVPYILDGEDMGSKIMLFDDITQPFLSYIERYELLHESVWSAGDELQVVKTAWKKDTKQIMFNRLINERAEGVVFKKINAPYTAGRPASGGSQFKCKFYDTASCIVESVSSVKNSIGLKVYDDSHPVSLVGVSVGNATLYPNSPKVKVGDIVEIKYLYYNEGGSLYQPVLKEVRDDVYPQECLLSKLKRKKD